MPDSDITNKRLLGIFSIEQVLSFLLTTVLIGFSAGFFYSAFAESIDANRVADIETRKQVEEQKENISKIKDSVDSVKVDIAEINGEQKRLNDKIDLVLDILQGKFD